MTDADSFLEAFRPSPDDDLPRLVYADWLEEHGEQAYAEFIRLSCHIAQETLPPDDRRELRRRRFELFGQFRAAHSQAMAGVRMSVNDFPRGIFTASFQVETSIFLQASPHWWPLICPREVTLLDPAGYEREIARAPCLTRVECLRCLGRFNYNHLSDEPMRRLASGALLRELASSPDATRLRGLDLDAVCASPGDLCALGLSSLALHLEALRLVVRLADDSDHVLRVEQATGAYEIRDELNSFAHGLAARLSPNPH